MKTVYHFYKVLCVLVVIGQLSLQSHSLFTDEDIKATLDKLYPKTLTPQDPVWEAPVKKSTTAFHLRTLDDILGRKNLLTNIKFREDRDNYKRSLDFKRGSKLGTHFGDSYDDTPITNSKLIGDRAKRSIGDRFGNIGNINVGDRFGNIGNGLDNYDSSNEVDNEIWDQSLLGKKTDEGTILKNMMKQDSTPNFGTSQEARDEQNTINEIENLSRQSSILPKDLQLPYMNGNSNNLGFDFSKMDVSVGKYSSDFDNNGEDSEASFLKRNSIPVKGHEWQTRNRDHIPRHRIPEPEKEEYDSTEHNVFPKLSRFPAFAQPDKIVPSQLESLEYFNAIPPIAPAIMSRERSSPLDPLPRRELEPEDEPAPVSEFIQSKEPAPIPELPSLREIPPISEQREPSAEDLNPKDTFGS